MRHLAPVLGLATATAALLCAAAMVVPGCGSTQAEPDRDGDPSDGGVDGTVETDADPGPTFDADISDAALPPSCVNLQCKQVTCDGAAKTTVSGVVYDPAGKNPLYNVIVYVPNAKLAPMTHGATCDRCGSIASGSPVVTTLTNTKGEFVLENVPVGANIPLVIQIGKWRKEIVVPSVAACTDNPVTDKNLTRLPRNKSEGDMPLVALSTGCDPMECLFRKIGIDDAEFTGAGGTGMVHIYSGTGGGRAGGDAGSASAYPFWADLNQLKKYDIVINACECSPYDRGAAAYPAMHDYLTAGGRFFGSHYHYNWFAPPTGPLDFQSVATWAPGSGTCTTNSLVDDTFPKGKAFADWLQNTGATTKYGEILLSCAPQDVVAAKPNLSQRWIYEDASASPSYVSFNTPLDAGVDDAGQSTQCGRAVFADLHVSSGGVANDAGVIENDQSGATFPGGCHTTSLSPQEKALEFMFFDLSSCVQKDSDSPKPPTPPK